MATDTQTIDKIKRLRTNAAALGGFFERFGAEAAKHDCDKHGAGFGVDNRFSAFKVEVSFDSYTGYYGSSSCSSALSVEREIVQPFFTRALNTHKAAIFATMAALMNTEAASLTGKARAEIAALQAMMDEVSPLEASVSTPSQMGGN